MMFHKKVPNMVPLNEMKNPLFHLRDLDAFTKTQVKKATHA